ncbi:hypothetical protein DICPUDRAFT_74547 [Dictyostelium purpureum]|uniref:Uncharacterized protein n=1 Tax=Dictyostelium purpureum TaxID=5786 RepID=F0Z824_DICPU|nr:uncharacterized protein DICPUDRAFT_74547 [Dictyostelium purpureum]EGC39916.1 hypothetical protein DICPUDRAFT_74547 [Dictyostelium purpureum]|eukprot:XP_003283545.1 hypothetical protein DICPUDRAFT_74547 [Dictyostelium purpureum]
MFVCGSVRSIRIIRTTIKKQSSSNLNNNTGNNNNNNNNNNSFIDIEKLKISNNNICEISVSNNSYMTKISSRGNLLSTGSAQQPHQPSPLQKSQSSQQVHQSTTTITTKIKNC